MSAPTITELGLALSWITSTLMADSTITGVTGFGGVWDTMAPDATTRPFFIIQDMGGSDVINASGGKRIMSDLLIMVKAVGEAAQSASIETLANQADYDLSPTPGGANHFPIQFNGYWILSCIRQSPHNLTYLSGPSKLYTDRGGIYAVHVKTH